MFNPWPYVLIGIMSIVGYLSPLTLLIGCTILYSKRRSIATLLIMLGSWVPILSLGIFGLVKITNFESDVTVMTILLSMLTILGGILYYIGLLWYKIYLKHVKNV